MELNRMTRAELMELIAEVKTFLASLARIADQDVPSRYQADLLTMVKLARGWALGLAKQARQELSRRADH